MNNLSFRFNMTVPLGNAILVVAANEEVRLTLPKKLNTAIRSKCPDLPTTYYPTTGTLSLDARGTIAACIVTVDMEFRDITIVKMNQNTLVAAITSLDMTATQAELMSGLMAEGKGLSMEAVLAQAKILIGDGPSEIEKLLELLDEDMVLSMYVSAISLVKIFMQIDVAKLSKELACVRDALLAGMQEMPEE